MRETAPEALGAFFIVINKDSIRKSEGYTPENTTENTLGNTPENTPDNNIELAGLNKEMRGKLSQRLREHFPVLFLIWIQ